MRERWRRIPKDTRIAVVVAILALLQTVALLAFGLAATRSQRAEAEQGLRTLSALALTRGVAGAAGGTRARAAAGGALRLAPGAALRAGEAPLALRAGGRLLDRGPDAWVGGESPSGGGGAAAACEVRRRRLEARAPGAP